MPHEERGPRDGPPRTLRQLALARQIRQDMEDAAAVGSEGVYQALEVGRVGRHEFLRPIRATRESGSTIRSSTSSPLRSRSAGSSSPSSSARSPRLADAYEIIAGERRWRAAQRAGRHDIPVIVVEAGDREALEIAIVENVQRADLNALEEAAGYAQLGADYGYSHGDIARVVGKSRSHVANTTRLTNLPEHTRALLAGGQISAGHARALLAVAHPDALADRIVAQGLTVRDIERFGRIRARRPAAQGRPADRRRHGCPSGQARPRARDESHDPP